MDLAGIGFLKCGREENRRFRKALLDWYDKENEITVVSEIMLQQTRVDSSIPYYERFPKMSFQR